MLKHNMSDVGRKIYDSIAGTEFIQKSCVGSIIEYNYITKTASLKAPNPVTGNQCIYHDVKIQDINRGIETISLKYGDSVSVEFISATIPVVTGVFTTKNKKRDKYVHSGPHIARSVGRNA